ncbi:hypothetical protein CANINC_002210 [Pichia inconspicua]|uniref:Zn(2)-C6 fungal-type domain-containing protein n=1 Tax=Pichia inconspicua TaxID=52247 RepID=A0A4V6TTR8_9ASCO|nr:hypothetical protein CANINC_002210 [[Candida] inconspicua]
MSKDSSSQILPIEKVLSQSTFAEKKGRNRNNLACTGCRQRHIRCDGNGDPCSRCIAMKQECVYLEGDKKIVISVKYLNKLQDQISKLKVENSKLRSLTKPSTDTTQIKTDVPDIDVKDEDHEDHVDSNPVSEKRNYEADEPVESNKTYGTSITESASDSLKKSNEVIPPFLEKHGRLIHSRTGERLYIGSSSMTLFGLEINRLVAPLLNDISKETKSPENATSPVADAETVLEKEGNAYRIMLGKTHSRPGIDVNFTLPSYSYAMLLVDSFISYNDGCFYFFNEGLVKENLRRIYNDDSNGGFKLDYGIESLNRISQNDTTLETIWFCKLLLIFAIGEMYLGTANYLNGYKLNEKPKRKKQKKDENSKRGTTNAIKLPGSGFFNEASDLFTGLYASGSIDNCTREGSIEVLLLYAFYLQVADCTAASYFYFGIALRASLLLGMHVDVGKDNLNRFELEHRRRLWWTVYMYERMLALKAGLPLSLTDEDISTELPTDFDMSNPEPGCENYIFPEAEFISNCVKITKINANILRKLYNRQPSSNILPIVHEMVVSLLKWKKSLPNDINCDYSQQNLDISRLVVNMMTEYFQGVNLAVRPLLFHFVIENLKSAKAKNMKFFDLSTYSPVILALLNASFQASINTIRSLWAILPENMVAMFGYMDREYLFNATATLVLFSATFGVYEATMEHLDHALILFTKMRNLGNHPATLRREQILKLLTILDLTGAMSTLVKKHDDNVTARSSSPNNDKSFGYNVSVGLNKHLGVNEPSQTATFDPKMQFNKHNSDQNNEVVDNHDPTIKKYQIEQHKESTENHAGFETSSTLKNDLVGLSCPIDFMSNGTNQTIYNQTGFTTPHLAPFSPSLSLMFNHIDDIPEFDQLSSNGKDLELWKDVTSQAAWLQNDVGDDFSHLLDQNDI